MQGDVGLSIQQRTDLYLPMLAKTGQAYAIPPEWLVAFARVESSFRAGAVNNSAGDLKRGGSRGLCQLSLKTAQAIGYKGTPEGLFDPITNANFAGLLIVINMHDFKVDSLEDVAALYNSGRRFAQAPPSTKLLYVPAIRRWAAYYRDRARATVGTSPTTQQ
jgi:soluble lytic murein transglycosylase-like protein